MCLGDGLFFVGHVISCVIALAIGFNILANNKTQEDILGHDKWKPWVVLAPAFQLFVLLLVVTPSMVYCCFMEEDKANCRCHGCLTASALKACFSFARALYDQLLVRSALTGFGLSIAVGVSIIIFGTSDRDLCDRMKDAGNTMPGCAVDPVVGGLYILFSANATAFVLPPCS